MNRKEIRYELARELARYLLLHLQEELKKPPGVSDYIAIEGVSFRKITKDMIDTLRKEFPDISPKPPYFNLFKHWWIATQAELNLSGNLNSYYEATFKSQNQIFFFKVLDIKKNDSLLRKKYEENMEYAIHSLRAKGRNIGFDTIFSSENKMYPLLEIIVKRAKLPYRICTDILFEQNSFIQRAAYRIFDKELKDSFKKTDDILNSVLPKYIVEELKQNGKVKPKSIPSSSILFCDLVGFTNIASTLSPEKLLSELDECYSHFDRIVQMKGLEKIKTIGDSYMAASGIIESKRLHAVDAVLSALKIQEFLRKYQKSQRRKGLPSWKVRIGIHCGPVVCGVLGEQRFNFDIWGDTVNIAQRMEANGEADKVNISHNLYLMTKDFFDFQFRGKIPVKGKGEMEMYFVLRIKEELSVGKKGRTPDMNFLQKYIGHVEKMLSA
ncbi:MAG: adenylate/guanylate cyclase domain-containing protein [Leptospiraceae bacterium]|nr:adenylate/guanylate cyclase domain-containing protein [Leptospiraceae bacterium]MBK7055672.1 adenylate/guanylate cyclase domain-containing protein [Leptospiraceae bacterium]MBP9165401.1 adenylate/guanylate cyclase domain-containing protein [Leptospiraceae bacterium]